MVIGLHIGNLLDGSGVGIPVFVLLLFAALLLSLLIHTVLHELGHLVFGLISGYAFKSFRVGSLMLVRYEDEGFQLKRSSIAGTWGQCLLDPPGRYGEPFPYRLYLYGGVLFNVTFAVPVAAVSLLLPTGALTELFAMVFTLTGLLLAFVNWVPVKNAYIPNDGTNAQILAIDRDSSRYLWAQLKIAALNQEGVRLKNMPEAYFQAEANNYLASSLRVFRIGRLIDAQHFVEAEAAIDELLDDTSLVPIYRSMLELERVFIRILSDAKPADLGVLEQKGIRQLRKAMKDFPSILRFEYAQALLLDGDTGKANTIRERFEKTCLHYPNKADIESESELMELVAATHRKRQGCTLYP